MAALATPRMAALSPGQSPPDVSIPMDLVLELMDHEFKDEPKVPASPSEACSSIQRLNNTAHFLGMAPLREIQLRK